MMLSENSLLLEGDQAEIASFMEKAKYQAEDDDIGTDLSFHKFIPVPKGISNEWDWCMDNWGIDCDIGAYYDPQRRAYLFNYDEPLDSAIRGFLVVSKQFPKIQFTFEYYNNYIGDGDIATHGKFKFSNGVIELEEKDKVRIDRCPECCRPTSYERICGEERANGKYL